MQYVKLALQGKYSRYSKAELVIYILAALMLLYIAVSFINVITHNTSDLAYTSWNVFNLFRR